MRLIGYCVEGSLFLVYEFIENGNLSQHLRGSGEIGHDLRILFGEFCILISDRWWFVHSIYFPDREPLQWSTRVQIALDSARGLEYIHEHTVPVYIHRDIKSANILIDKNFHAKVILYWTLHQDGPFGFWTNNVVYDRWQILVWQNWLSLEAHLFPHDL